MNQVEQTATSPDMKGEILAMGAKALSASRELAKLTTEKKNGILHSMADELESRSDEIVAANAKDLAAGKEKGLSKPMLDRLALDTERVTFIAGCVRQVAELPDPVGEILDDWARPNGLHLQKVRVPIGVIGIIYESRPNVTSDAAVLCFKANNATILKGGSEAIHSNQAIAAALQEGGARSGLPEGSIQLIPFTDRESVQHLAEMDEFLDLVIPRGGKGLIEAVVSMARVPVIKHYDGICHAYVHCGANLEMAEKIVVNSKCQKPSVCNALETLLVDVSWVPHGLEKIAGALIENGVEIRGDAKVCEVLGDKAKPASGTDWEEEYLDLILAVKVVDGVGEAIAHINRHGSQHSDTIITEDPGAGERFMNEVDSAAVFLNCSTRFSDGEEFGFGAEIGVSTDKLHARGPMALKELTSYKYLVRGTGQLK